MQLLNDTVGPVRDAGAAAIGTAMKVVGEKFMTEYISDLDNIKKQKVCIIELIFNLVIQNLDLFNISCKSYFIDFYLRIIKTAPLSAF